MIASRAPPGYVWALIPRLPRPLSAQLIRGAIEFPRLGTWRSQFVFLKQRAEVFGNRLP